MIVQNVKFSFYWFLLHFYFYVSFSEEYLGFMYLWVLPFPLLYIACKFLKCDKCSTAHAKIYMHKYCSWVCNTRNCLKLTWVTKPPKYTQVSYFLYQFNVPLNMPRYKCLQQKLNKSSFDSILVTCIKHGFSAIKTIYCKNYYIVHITVYFTSLTWM